MKAVVYYDRNDVKYVEDYPEPHITRPTDVKLKVHYCGICGSDLKEYTDGPIFFSEKDGCNPISNYPTPQCMGHEMSAEVIELGDEVEGLEVGDKVVVEVTGTCKDSHRFPDAKNYGEEHCEACKEGCYNACSYLGLTGLGFTDGGFAEYVVTDSSKVLKFAEDIPMDIAALVQPLAVSWHAVKVPDFKDGESALIIGGGPIGLTTIFALKGHKAGSIVVSEPALARRELAETIGAKVFDPTNKSVEECVEELRKLSPGGNGYDKCFDCSGFPATFETALKSIKPRGYAVNVAVWAHKPIDFYPMDITFREKFLTGSICFVKEDFQEVIEAIENNLIDRAELRLLITSVIHLEDGIAKGFNELLYNKQKHIKILFSPKDEHKTT